MLLRSSSTPILGSLVSSSPLVSESPNRTLQSFSPHNPTSSGVRRTRSAGNLHALLTDLPHDPPRRPPTLRCSLPRRPNPVLETIPSFSALSSQALEEEADGGEEDENDAAAAPFDAEGSGVGRESGEKQDVGSRENASALPLFLARGLGIDRVGSGLLDVGGDGVNCGDCGGGQSDLEMHYKRMIEQDPCNAIFLSNYAQFLYQFKGDPKRAEEYYSRAILAEPGDGEILAQYAKLVWELHRDVERASSYFEQAVQAAPHDSHVLAAHAHFLWEADDDDGVGIGDVHSPDYNGLPHYVAFASASTF